MREDHIMDKEQKGLKVAYAKGIDAEKKTVTAYVSTYDWDRTDERFSMGSWRVDNLKKYPVVMWGHDYPRPPVGKAVRIEEDDNGLLAETQFADTEDGKMTFELFKGGFLSAFSVGFAPRKWTMEPINPERKGVVYTDAELLEYSAVGIPANPGALIGRDIGVIAQKMMPNAVREIEVDGEAKFLVMDPTLGTPEAPDFESSLKSCLELARDARRNRLPGNQLSLLKSVSALFSEILVENEEGVDESIIAGLIENAKGLSQAIMAQYTDEQVRKQVRRIVTELQRY